MKRPGIRARGFTLIEVMVVLAIIGLLALLSLNVLSDTKPRQAIARAPKQLSSAFENARNYALSIGRGVVMVVEGNADGAADAATNAAKCGDTLLPDNDSRCIRYWILEDSGVGTAAFDSDTEVQGFDPTALPATLTLLEKGSLPRYVYFGRHAGFTPPAVPAATSALVGVALDTTAGCSLCTTSTGSRKRALLRFTADGDVILGFSGAPYRRGDVFYLAASTPDGDTIPDTRAVVILQPSGFVLDRITRAQ